MRVTVSQTDWAISFLLRCSQREEVLLPPVGRPVSAAPSLPPCFPPTFGDNAASVVSDPTDVDCFRRPKSVHPDGCMADRHRHRHRHRTLLLLSRRVLLQAGDVSAARNTHRVQRKDNRGRSRPHLTNDLLEVSMEREIAFRGNTRRHIDNERG